MSWRNSKSAFEEALLYLKNRQTGVIKSFRTPWLKFDDAGVDGIEWHSTVVIAGRPGAGKTLIKDQIIREAFTLNPGDDFRVLEFSLEMVGKVTAIREFTSVLGKSYKHLCSAGGGKITNEELSKLYTYAKTRVENPVDVIEEACTVDEFVRIVDTYMETYKGPLGYKKTIITVDHTLLFKLNGQSEREMLVALAAKFTELKKKYPIIFIVLSQLKRDVDTPERAEEGKYGNYILDSDIMGSDAMFQHADILVGINRPFKQRIRFYGPDKYIIEDDKTLVFHFLKCRNGDPRMSFFKAEFHQMKVSEMATPGTKEMRFKGA